MAEYDDEGLTTGDRDAIAYHEDLIKAAAANQLFGEVRRNEVIINRIRSQAKDRLAEGVVGGDADGFTRTGGLSWVTRLLRFVPSRSRSRHPQELLHGDRQDEQGVADVPAETPPSGAHAGGVAGVLAGPQVGAEGVPRGSEEPKAAAGGAVLPPGLAQGPAQADGDGRPDRPEQPGTTYCVHCLAAEGHFPRCKLYQTDS